MNEWMNEWIDELNGTTYISSMGAKEAVYTNIWFETRILATRNVAKDSWIALERSYPRINHFAKIETIINKVDII